MNKAAQGAPSQADLALRIAPGAPRSELVGQLADGSWKVKIAAPPVDGKANAALLKFLAGKLRVSPAQLTLIRGDKSRQKIVRVEGLSPAAVVERLKR